MIRFVDIRGQGTPHRFAFWDTIRDAFCKFGDCQAWGSVVDFIEDFEYSHGHGGYYRKEYLIERFMALMPDWAHLSEEEW